MLYKAEEQRVEQSELGECKMEGPTPALCSELSVFVLLKNGAAYRSSWWSEELRQRCRQIDKVNRLRDIIAEASLDALILNVGHDIGGQRNNG